MRLGGGCGHQQLAAQAPATSGTAAGAALTANALAASAMLWFHWEGGRAAKPRPPTVVKASGRLPGTGLVRACRGVESGTRS